MVKEGVGTLAYHEALAYIYKQNKAAFYARLSRSPYQLTDDVVKDIYHQGIVILVQKIQQNKIMEQSIPAYLWGICHHLYLQYRDKQIRSEINKTKYTVEQSQGHEEGIVEAQLLDESYRQLVDQLFKSIGEKCRTILLMRQMHFSYREIAQKLNPDSPSSDTVIRVMAGRCVKKLIRLVEEQPELKKQIEELLT